MIPTRWRSPVPGELVCRDRDTDGPAPKDKVWLPTGVHPGAFGVRRRHHTHEGVDLYVPEGTAVTAVEDGRVVAIEWFTGPTAGSPWWLDTQAVLVEGASGVVLYGEIVPTVRADDVIRAGEAVGWVRRVLRHDKGRPVSMLHLELHEPGTRRSWEWGVGEPQPSSLRDPTNFLRNATPSR